MISPSDLKRLREAFPGNENRGDHLISRWGDPLPLDAGPLLWSDGITLRAGRGIRHTAVFGATGAGKSRSYLVHSIKMGCMSSQNMIVSDCKGELHEMSSGYLSSQGYSVGVLNFADPCHSHCISLFKLPYELIRKGSSIDVAQGKGLLMDLSKILCPVTSEHDPTWETTASTMVYALAFLCIIEADSCEDVTFDNIIKRKNALLENSIRVQMAIDSLEEHPDVQSVIRIFRMDAKTTLSCYCVILEQALIKYAFNSALSSVLSRDEISPDLLISGEKQAFFIIFPDETSTYSPLVSSVVKIFYESLIRAARGMVGKTLENRTHFLLDEFSQMPLVDFPATISAARSRNIMFTLVMQSLSQLTDKFGSHSADTILNNCSVWIYLGGSDTELIKKFAEFGGIDKKQLMYLDRERGDAVVREANRRPYVTKLVDLSHYDGWCNRPLDLPVTGSGIESVQKGKDVEIQGSGYPPAPEFNPSADPIRNLLLLGDSFSSLDAGLRVSQFSRMIEGMAFDDVEDLVARILEETHFEHVSQKELAGVLKWACFDPTELAQEITGRCSCTICPVLSRSQKRAFIDFICAFALMDDGRYRMYGPMVHSGREWARLREVMVTEGWSLEEADVMRGTLHSLGINEAWDADLPRGYIGACLDDEEFEEVVKRSMKSAIGKTVRFDVEALRRLVYIAQMDYDADKLTDILIRYIESGKLDLQARNSALSLIPVEQQRDVVDRLKRSLRLADRLHSTPQKKKTIKGPGVDRQGNLPGSVFLYL